MECDLLNMQGDPEIELHAFSEFDVWLDLHFDIEAAFSAIDLTFLKYLLKNSTFTLKLNASSY